jgi:hypothetical protein
MVNYMKSLFESFEQTFLFAMSRKVNSNGVFAFRSICNILL